MRFKVLLMDESRTVDIIETPSNSTASYSDFCQLITTAEKIYLKHCLEKHGSIRKATKENFKAPIGTIHGRMKKLGVIE